MTVFNIIFYGIYEIFFKLGKRITFVCDECAFIQAKNFSIKRIVFQFCFNASNEAFIFQCIHFYMSLFSVR